MVKSVTSRWGRDDYLAYLASLSPEDREQIERQHEEVERDNAFPRDDPPRVAAHYRRTWSPFSNPLIDWATSDPDNPSIGAWHDENLRHEMYRAAFYAALYEIGESDETVSETLRELACLAALIRAGALTDTKDRSNRYGLDNALGSKEIAAWLERHRLESIPLIGSDILASTAAMQYAEWMGNLAPFRLRVYPPPHTPGTYPRGHMPHTPGWPDTPSETLDVDSVDVSIRGSWRKNARAQTMAGIKTEILSEIEQLLDRELTPVFETAKRLHVGPDRARKTALHMRWLVLYHFKDVAGNYRIPEQVAMRERELSDTDATGPICVKSDSVHSEAVKLSKKLGLDLMLKRGAPAKLGNSKSDF